MIILYLFLMLLYKLISHSAIKTRSSSIKNKNIENPVEGPIVAECTVTVGNTRERP